MHIGLFTSEHMVSKLEHLFAFYEEKLKFSHLILML